MSIPFVEKPVQASSEGTSSHDSAAIPSGGKPPRRSVMPVLPTWAVRAAVCIAALVLLAVGVRIWVGPGEPVLPTLALTELLTAMDAGRVEALTVRPGLDIRGTWTGAADAAEAQFAVTYTQQSVDALVERAEAAGVEVTLAPVPERRTLEGLFTLGVQVLLLAVIGWFLLRHFRGGENARELGTAGGSDVTFGDVAGTQGAAEELREVVDFLRAPQRFAALGARVPKGALLVGPPGTGKTLLARAVAGEAGVPFYSISGSEVTGFLVGMGAHRIKSLFRRARKKGGVIFIDEIDALGGKRGRNRSHNEDDRTLNQLLVEMDGFSPLDGVVVIAATNRPDDLDEALKRPGRFDRVITVAPPTAAGREAILRLHVERRGIPLHAGVDLARLGRLTTGASGADLANLLNEAAIAAVRDGKRLVEWSHLEMARDRMLLGKERTGFRAVDQERCTIAYHEAGHALVGVLCSREDGLHKVTIQARGQAMGVAFFSPDDDRVLYRRSYLDGLIMKGLGGRAAEEVVFGAESVTSGAQSDLQQVNAIARKMVYQLGMGTETGLLIHDGEQGSLSAEAHARMDREVRAMLERAYDRTRAVIQANREALAALAVALLERETIDGDEAVRIMEEAGLTRPAWTDAPAGALDSIPADTLASEAA